MSDASLFATPQHVTDVADCDFYHVMELPEFGRVGGEWDLRGRESSYLGDVSFQGKRVLEMGTASGHLCRFMEGRGADVIGYDASPAIGYDLVPFAGIDLDGFRGEITNHIRRLNNSWWLTRRLFGSNARKVYGSVYDVPEAIGPVDIATFGSILLHLRDPFHALYNALRLTRETAIVTEVHPIQPADSGLGSTIPEPPAPKPSGFVQRLIGAEAPAPVPAFPGTVYFLPNQWMTNPASAVSWWSYPPEIISRFLGVLGFEDQVLTEHSQIFHEKETRMYTLVGKRTKGAVKA
jgi:hypothetical protein